MPEKPPVLSDEEIDQVWPDFPKEIIDRECPLSSSELEIIARQLAIAARVVAQAQRDADVAWYQRELCDHCDTPLLREGELYEKVEQAKAEAEVAREIFEEIERERFAEPQYIPQSGREPVIVCLTETDLQSLKDKHLKGGK